MQLKIYQENAIDDLLEKAKRLLNLQGTKKLVFKSPTGSGKTIMMAEFLKQLVDDREIRQSLGFIWTAPRQLHIQSRDKLENYFETSRALKCSYFEDLDNRKISENEILFFNWESINRADNVYIRDYENEILNYGYVYTNLDNIEIKEDIAKDYITIYTSKRRAEYKPINLFSCYPKRHRENTRLSPLSQEIFLKQAKAYNSLMF
jgi:type III restriction enzyme